MSCLIVKNITRRYVYIAMLITFMQLYAIDIFQARPQHLTIKQNLQVESKQQNKTIVENSTVLKVYSVIFFRIWSGDEFGISPTHLAQWIHYMRYAGVSQIHLYDNCHEESECQDGLATLENVDSYTRWLKGDYAVSQRLAYEDSIRRFRLGTDIWLLHHDIDEYPFAPKDREPGFLLRFVTGQHVSNRDSISQILLQCMFFGQQNEKLDGSDVVLISKYNYRMPATEGVRVRTKPLFRPDSVQSTSPNIVHEMLISQGETLDVSPSILRINHYWGYRLQKEPSALVHDSSISYIADKIARIGHRDAI